ncbi:MAG: hypothetical protein LBI45_07285 [Bacteroidales bacterium]|jgi:hypothetical protein|nr:hypothetical protein [Bacteroidales bacterium]
MSEVLKDEAALWHESRQAEIQAYEEPAFIESEPEPMPEDPKEHISDKDVRTELNMLKLNEPTAEIIISLMDYLMIIPLSFICKGITREETKVEADERDTLVQACAAYLKTTSFNLSPGVVFLTTVLTIYGAKVAAFHFNKKPEPEFIQPNKKEDEK